MWPLLIIACTLTVDFVPGDTEPGSVEDSLDTGAPPRWPRLVEGTECDGTAAEPPVIDDGFELGLQPISGRVEFEGAVERVLFGAVDADVDVRVGDVPGATVEVLKPDGAVAFANRSDDGQLLVFSFCALETCAGHALRVTLPLAAVQILGETETGDVTITDAATDDVVVATDLGTVSVSGATLGIRALALDGAVSIDAPAAEIVDASTSTGSLTIRGSVPELCALSGLGDLDVAVSDGQRVALETTNGDVVADLASRPRSFSLTVVVGGADVTLPGGAYAIDLVSLPEDSLTLDGIVHDAAATDRITGSSLGTGTALRAR